MYIVIWEFYIKGELRSQFEEVYGPDGTWAQFFRRDKEYVGTVLLRDVDNENRYATIDSWTSKKAYEMFRDRWAEEYAAIDTRCESFTEHEECVGSFHSSVNRPTRPHTDR